MKQVAAQMPELVTRYARAYSLSKEATDAWQGSIFANPDIPSIIIPNRTVMEFANRTDETHPGKTFADLQRQIESDLTDMVNQDRGGGFTMAEFVKLHHTPSNAGETVALMEPAVNGKQKDFTPEWQFAVKGQRAVPVLDSVANDLKKNFNIDLETQLEADGYSYGELRKQGLEQTVEFLSIYARSRIEAHGSGKDITPRVIVPVDTYYEANGKVDGSDASLTRSAAAKLEPNLLDGMGRGSQPPPARNRPAPAGKKGVAAAPKPSSERQNHGDRVRREGTKLQLDKARELSIHLPMKTEFKQGGPDPFAGMADGPRHNVNQAIAFGSKLAHSRLIGVAQIGEGIGLATDIVKGLDGAINGTPEFFSDTGDLISGRTKTSKREVAAGVASGLGKFAYGMGAGLVDLGARVVMPGDWRDNVSKGAGQGQQWLDNGYRGAVKSVGVNPDAVGYNVASTTTQVVGTVASFFIPAKATKGGALTKVVNVGSKEGRVASKAGGAGMGDILANIDKHLSGPELQQRLARSNSPAEIARQNAAIEKMRADGKVTASHVRPNGGANAGCASREPQAQLQRQPSAPTQREGLPFADPAPHTTLDIAPGTPPATAPSRPLQRMAEPGDIAPLPRPATNASAAGSRPLPAKVEQAAAALGIPGEVAKVLRATYGGPFTEARIVKYMVDTFPNHMTQASATALARVVRKSQSEGMFVVMRRIAEARAQIDSSGRSAPTFSEFACNEMRSTFSAQPLFDNDTARALFKVAADPKFHNDRGHNRQVIEGIRAELMQSGYDQTNVLDRLPSPAFKVGDRHVTMVGVDAVFARRLAQSGLASSSPGGKLGVVDEFVRYVHPSARVNTAFIEQPALTNRTVDHGHQVASVAGQGLGQWGDLRLADAKHADRVVRSVDRLAATGVKTINISMGPTSFSDAKLWLDVFRAHPDVKFVMAAGNAAKTQEAMPGYRSAGKRLDNVTYIGNVDANSALAADSNSGRQAIYAFGGRRPVATVTAEGQGFRQGRKDLSATSFASPEVANLYHQMDVLNPALTPSQAKKIVFATADHLAKPGDSDGLVRRLPVIHRADAITVAMKRQQRPVVRAGAPANGQRAWTAATKDNPLTLNESADILRLTAAERSRLLPIVVRTMP